MERTVRFPVRFYLFIFIYFNEFSMATATLAVKRTPSLYYMFPKSFAKIQKGEDSNHLI